MDPKQFLMQRPLAIACLAITYGGLTSIASAQDTSDNNEPHAVDEIIVQGVPLDRTIKELAQPTSVLSGDELLKRQAASIGELNVFRAGLIAAGYPRSVRRKNSCAVERSRCNGRIGTQRRSCLKR